MKTFIADEFEFGKTLGCEVPEYALVRIITVGHDPIFLWGERDSDGRRCPLFSVSGVDLTFRLRGFAVLELVSKSEFGCSIKVKPLQVEEPRSDEAFVAVPLENISPLLRMRDRVRAELRAQLGLDDADMPVGGYEVDDDDDPFLEEPDFFGQRVRERPQGSSEDPTPEAEPGAGQTVESDPPRS